MTTVKSGQGLVVERTGRSITALSRTGDLVTFRSDRDDVMVGMEVSLPARASLFTWRRLAPAVALSLVIVLSSSLAYQQFLYAQPVVAYMTVDSAGSVELEINQAGLVKSATGLDTAGQEALAAVDFRNKRADEVMEALAAVQDPGKKSDVVVAIVPVSSAAEPTAKDTEKAEKAMEKLEKKVRDRAAVTERNVTSLRLGPEVRESAQKLGISAGRAALWALSQRNRPEEQPGPGPIEPEAEPGEEPGKETPGEGAMQPPEQEEDEPGKKGAAPPGQEKKDNVLDSIKGALPQVDPETFTDLNERKDAKDREKYLKDLTKEWVDRIVEELRENKKPAHGNEDKSGESTPPGKSGQSGGQGEHEGGQDPGKGSAKGEGSKDDGSGKSGDGGDKSGKAGSGGKGKGTSSQPGSSRPSRPGNVSVKKPEESSEKTQQPKHGSFAQVIEDILGRLPWRRK